MASSRRNIPQYPWYEDEGRELETRCVIRQPGAYLNRRGQVCLAFDKGNPQKQYVVKAVPKGSQEAINFAKFHASQRSSRNRIVPAEVVECEHCLLIIMLFLTVFTLADGFLDQTRLLNAFTSVMKGLDLMHEQNVAFIDIAVDNLVLTEDEPCEIGPFKIPAHEVFFIDYGSSRQMPSGPGSGVVIHDYETMGGHHTPPEPTDSMDPFAYDIYALGQMIRYSYALYAMNKSEIRIGPSVQGFVDVLSNPVPARRPDMKQVMQLWSVITSWISVLDRIEIENVARRDALDAAGWKIILSRYLRSS